jgi:hypothetical protein
MGRFTFSALLIGFLLSALKADELPKPRTDA